METTLQKSIFRVFGTVLGGALGFAAMTDTRSAQNPYALMAILCTIAFFASFLTNSPVRSPLLGQKLYPDSRILLVNALHRAMAVSYMTAPAARCHEPPLCGMHPCWQSACYAGLSSAPACDSNDVSNPPCHQQLWQRSDAMHGALPVRLEPYKMLPS